MLPTAAVKLTAIHLHAPQQVVGHLVLELSVVSFPLLVTGHLVHLHSHHMHVLGIGIAITSPWSIHHIRMRDMIAQSTPDYKIHISCHIQKHTHVGAVIRHAIHIT